MLNIIAAVLIFGLIVFIHELGHFLLAKASGIGVLEFSIGMGPRILSVTKGETRYSIKLLPFGGSCMMLGEDGDEKDERAFNNKSVWARIATIVAGPVFNFVLAYVFAVVIVSMVGFDVPVLAGIEENSPAQEAGLLPGDKIAKINGRSIYTDRELLMHMSFYPGEPLDLEYKRVDETTGKAVAKSVTVVPKFNEEYNSYMMGVQLGGYEKTGSVLKNLQYSVYELRYYIVSTVDGLKMMFTGRVKAGDAVSGPVGIVNMIGGVVEESKSYGILSVVLSLINLSMILSVSLGFMNLLPIPALDGGRLVFLLIEAVRGKPINREKEGMVHLAGFMVLMALMILVLFNDIRKLF